MSQAFILTAGLPMLLPYGSKEGGENIGIIVENKHINELKCNLECVIIFRHRFSVLNIC